MKKALDYVSDYQLKSACKDAICIALSQVTQTRTDIITSSLHTVLNW